jgi:hypothetical protein
LWRVFPAYRQAACQISKEKEVTGIIAVIHDIKYTIQKFFIENYKAAASKIYTLNWY